MNEYDREALAKLAYHAFYEMTERDVFTVWSDMTDQDKSVWRNLVELLFRHHDCRNTITALQIVPEAV